MRYCILHKFEWKWGGFEYDEYVLCIVNGYGFEIVKSKNSLTSMVKEVNTALSNCQEILGIPKYKLISSNPKIPTIYIFYITHTIGTRRIIANVDSPTSKIAKFLVQKFNCLRPPEGLFVKNSFEVADKLSKLHLDLNEEMVLFDVTAIYPNVLIDEALDCFFKAALQKKVDS
uniref:Uncharacterized protein n=1 Tax=Megaselia scalaris TaxID=36166 RepID=T1GQN8_MEGSC